MLAVTILLFALQVCTRLTDGLELSPRSLQLQQLSADMQALRQHVTIQDHSLEELIQSVNKHGLAIEEHRRNIARLRNDMETAVETVESKIATVEAESRADIRYARQDFGCLLDTVDLSCAQNTEIAITGAKYGKYFNACSECCTPSSNDCFETMADNSPAKWEALKGLCNNQTECSVLYEGIVINECELGYVADYLEISYDCVGTIIQDDTDPAGFTAYATLSRTYAAGEALQFNAVLTNINDTYDSSDSTFTCPIDGAYLLSIHFLSAVNDDLYVELMRGDDTALIQAYADADSERYTQASVFVITECLAGEKLWARAAQTGTMFSDQSGLSHFTGWLLDAI